MKYEKPQIVAESAAIRAIQVSLIKGVQVTDEDCHGSGGSAKTNCAYVADE
jgi:hypothetical protein